MLVRWTHLRFLVALAIAALASVAMADDGYRLVAHEDTTVNHDEMARLRTELTSLQQNLDASVAGDPKAPAAAANGAGCGSACGCCGTSCGCCAAPSCGCCESSCCQSCGDCCCCCKGGWLFDAELTFLRFHRENDFRNPDVFDYEISPRFTLGYVGSNCLGVRASYWEYDHTNRVGNDVFSVDTYNLDVEGFTVTPLTCRTSVEWSAGIRYNDYIHALDGDDERFSGYGALVGVKVVHCVTGNISVYARAKWAILMDDGFDDGNVQFDTVRTHEELAAGAIYSTCLCNGMVFGVFGGYEFTDWTSYEDGDESVGFGGFNVGASLRY